MSQYQINHGHELDLELLEFFRPQGSDVSGFEKPAGWASKYLGQSPARIIFQSRRSGHGPYSKAHPKPVGLVNVAFQEKFDQPNFNVRPASGKKLKPEPGPRS